VDPRRHPWNRAFEWHDHTGPFRALDGAQVRHYDRHGYVVVPDLVSPDLLADVTAAVDPFDAKAEAFLRSVEGERVSIAEAGAITFSVHLAARSPVLRRLVTDAALTGIAVSPPTSARRTSCSTPPPAPSASRATRARARRPPASAATPPTGSSRSWWEVAWSDSGEPWVTGVRAARCQNHRQMATLAELSRFFTRLEAGAIAHLQRLVASWGLLADFCFADLLLFGVVGEPHEGGTNRFVVLGQVRPTTSQTVYRADWVGTVLEEEDRPLVARAYRLGEIIEGETVISPLKERVRVLCIPIRYQGRVVGVLTRESAPSFGRQPGELERTYVDVFNRFARMIASGDFPFDGDEAESEEAPRVGDGAIVLDYSGRVEYTSPNAVSTLHRLGVHANAEGLRFSELGLEEMVVRTAFETGTPATEELSRGVDITVLIRGIPLLDQGAVTGAVVLLRDISELRRRDLLLLSKDATIREIHHRVKNNLQTISSLLRLQGRRLARGEAKTAIEESVRRIRSIALVHEILSREAGDDVPFVDIVKPVVGMVADSMISPEHPIRFDVDGDGGILPAGVATPLAVVLNELLQNAVDHAYPQELDLTGTPGQVRVEIARDGRMLRVRVSDDGVGLPPGFQLDQSTGLGLSIVRTLVTGDLAGEISIAPGSGDGDRPGTEVALSVAVDAARDDDLDPTRPLSL
jgi:two-component sensor histidine kinase